MYTPPHEHQALIDQLSRDINWAVACIYRTKRQEGFSDGPARYAAILMLERHVPHIRYFELAVTVGIIIDRAADDYGERFWEGIDLGWQPVWVKDVKIR